MKKKGKIGVKLVLGVSLIITIALLAVGEISILKSKEVLENNLYLTSIQTLKEVDKGFSKHMDIVSNQVNVLTKNHYIPKLLDTNLDHNAIIKEVQEFLKVVKENLDGTVNVYFGGEYGEFITDRNVQSLGEFNFKERDWYKTGREANGKILYTKPYEDSITGKQVMTVVKSVDDGNGNFIGVIGFDILVDSMKEYISEIELLKTGYVLLVDSDGNIIIDNEKNNIAKDTIKTLEFWGKASSEENGTYKWKINGETMYSCKATNAETGWQLIGIINEKEVSDNMSIIQLTIFIGVAAAIIIGILVVLMLALAIVKEIKKLNKSIDKVSKGDFTEKINVTANDEFGELGDNFNYMIDNVAKLMKNVQSTSNELIEASVNISSMSEETTASVSEVANAISEVAKGATSQAHAAVSVSTNMDSLSNKIDEIDKGTDNIGNLSEDAEKLSNRGIRTLNALIEKSKKTRENSIESTQIVNEMAKSIEKINYMSNAIAGITEQTNLLSLNASIEAARAGDSGKGFAVVATEIRKLADESKHSTDEIRSIVEEINIKANDAKKAMEESTSMLEVQDKAIKSTKEIFNEIVSSINSLTNAIKNIKVLNENMGDNKEKVRDEVENISSVSEETASVSEEVTASAEEVTATMDELTEYANQLNNIANQLKEEIKQFVLE